MSLKSNIFLYDGKSINVKDLCDILGKNIEFGSDLYIEFNLSSFGNIHPDIKTRDQLASNIFLAFSEVSGPNATILIPSFTFSWGKNSNHIFDIDSKTHLGLMPNWFLFQEDVHRSYDPMYSVLAKGKNSKYYSKKTSNSFGRESVFSKLHDSNAKLIGFGLNFFDPTFIHYIEQYFDENIAKIKYRYLKEFHGKTRINNEISSIQSHKCFVRNTAFKFNSNYEKLSHELRNNNALIEEKFCDSSIYISESSAVFDIGISILEKDPHYFISSE
jgi:aminoglycoside 3-N-acetyltransferase